MTLLGRQLTEQNQAIPDRQQPLVTQEMEEPVKGWERDPVGAGVVADQLLGRRLQISVLQQCPPWRDERVGAHREQITPELAEDAGVLASLTQGSKVLGEGREQGAEDHPTPRR